MREMRVTLHAVPYEQADWYSDVALVDEPAPISTNCARMARSSRRGTTAPWPVVGYEETVALVRDAENFSEINAVIGSLVELQFT